MDVDKRHKGDTNYMNENEMSGKKRVKKRYGFGWIMNVLLDFSFCLRLSVTLFISNKNKIFLSPATLDNRVNAPYWMQKQNSFHFLLYY